MFLIVLDSSTSKSMTPFFSDLLHPRPYESDLPGVGKGKITHVGSSENVTSPTKDDKTSRDEDLFLSWHIKLGHAPLKNIQYAAT